MFSTKSLVCALAVSGLMAGPALAATSTWTGGGDGMSWTDAGNWDTAPANDGTTDVVFNGATPAGGTTIDLGGSQDINSINFDNDSRFTLGTGSSQTLTVQSGTIGSDGPSGIAASVVLGADGTTGTQSYENSLVFNGPIGETGGPRSLTFNTDGGRSTYINGNNTYTGATMITDGRENVFTGSTMTSSVSVSDAALGILTADNLGAGALSFNNGILKMGGADITINNATSIGGTFETASITSYGTNFIPSFPGTRGHGVITFANPVNMTSDVTIDPGAYYQKGPHFNGFTGAHKLTYDGEYQMSIDGASTYSGGTLVYANGGTGGNGNSGLYATADGALGVGDVTVSSATVDDQAYLILETASTIDPTATLTLSNGWNLALDFNGTQVLGGLVIDGNAVASGTTVDSSDFQYITGDGSLLVTAVPEPASLALMGLGGLAMLGRRRRRRRRGAKA